MRHPRNLTSTRRPATNLLLLLLLGLICAGCSSSTIADPKTPANVPQITVLLEIDYRERQENISIQHDVSEGDSVLRLLQAAQKAGQLEFEFRGGGETAFIESIDGVKNEGSNGSNWLYLVNGELADRGCGVKQLASGDKVKWLFSTKYPPD